MVDEAPRNGLTLQRPTCGRRGRVYVKNVKVLFANVKVVGVGEDGCCHWMVSRGKWEEGRLSRLFSLPTQHFNISPPRDSLHAICCEVVCRASNVRMTVGNHLETISSSVLDPVM